MTQSKQCRTVLLFAVAMAWVESAVVYYLRTMVDRIEPHQPNPLPLVADLGQAELIREVATIIMLYTVGWLAGRTPRSRFGYFLIAFGLWDIFYYIFLKVMTGWPDSLLDWDILFLIPLPWWGPVLAPALIAGMMILAGLLLTTFDRPEQPLWPRYGTITLNVIGSFLALYVFMADAIRALPHGEQAIRETLPNSFNWPLFLVALSLMFAPVVEMALEVRARSRLAVQPIPVIEGQSSDA
jgi:hypothetical protein